MGNPITMRAFLAAATTNGISVSQIPAAAGDLTITGTLASGGVATLAPSGAARQVLITTGANETGKTLTVYGTNATGNAISEVVNAPNATTATTTAYFNTVTRVAVSAAFTAITGTVIVGTNGVGGSRVMVLDSFADPFNTSIAVVATGTVNYTLQYTYDDPNTTTNPTWIALTALSAKTSTLDSIITAPVFAIQLKINSSTSPGGAVATVIQPGPR